MKGSDQPPSNNTTSKKRFLKRERSRDEGVDIVRNRLLSQADNLPDAPAPQDGGAAAVQQKGSSTIAVIAAICGNILVGIVKFIAAFITGSQAMISEGIHSIVDSGNGILVLFGIHQSKKPSDEDHPFGYGKELYFWTLVVAVLIFAVGGVISLVEGVSHLVHIEDARLSDPLPSLVILGISAVIEGTTLAVAIKQFNLARGKVSPLKFIDHCKDPSLYTVVLEDTAAETGLLIAFAGIVASHVTGNPLYDSLASIAIAVLLMVVAAVLLTQTKALLIGEGLNKPQTRRVIEIVESDENVVDCGRVLSMFLGPHDMLLTIDANFSPSVPAVQILRSIDRIEAGIRAEFPDATRVFIEVESLKSVQDQALAFEMMESDDEEEEREREEREAAGDDEQPAFIEFIQDKLDDIFEDDETLEDRRDTRIDEEDDLHRMR
ncbi:MAG: cation diffusion facilitator family transporter [Coriobacteriia bacterium]|nr:cation diffusion facilitator family transporter [Coriobacteriia bacterium]